METNRWWLLVLALATLAACGTSSADSSVPVGGSGAQAVSGQVLVLAASSLTDGFDDMASAFEAEHREVDVVVSVAASSALREQLLEGAPADVFASADEATMGEVIGAGLVDDGAVESLATNTMVVGVGADRAAEVTDVADLARPELLIGLCAPGVPCGDLGAEALALAGVNASVDSYEPNARALVAKIADGELDAGLVYASDAVSNANLVAVPLPSEARVETTYPIAVLSAAPNPVAARAFVDFALSNRGQRLLAEHGFTGP